MSFTKFTKFPSIEQFRHVVHNINYLELPSVQQKIKFRGTVKLHGTNAGVGSYKNEFWIQSRSSIITQKKDNYGFAKFVGKTQPAFNQLFKAIRDTINDQNEQSKLVLFGEWCGSGVQKNVAISTLEKMFVIFAIHVSYPEKPVDPDIDLDNECKKRKYWLNPEIIKDIDVSEHRIFKSCDFQSWEITIDFNEPKLSQNKLCELTDQVEKCCPVGKFFGQEGLGEGIVWVGEHNGILYKFKVKGEKHSVSKVKTLAAVDVEKLNSISEFVTYSVTENRLKQGLTEVFGIDTPNIKKLGKFIKWMCGDVEKEEIDTIKASGLTMKDVKGQIAAKTRKWFIQNF